jgi:hypothetical protein
LRRGELRLELLQLSLVDIARCLLEARLGDLILELGELPLGVLPLAVVVVSDHPDDGDEQEHAACGENDVEEIDVVCVPDALLLSHD